jgi:hypothetical protein
MISIVICSVKPAYYAQVSASIVQTIGVVYELIPIDNSANTYSIFEAYNLGVQQAKYSIVCFAHEDIVFHTPSWGVNVINHFKDESIGMIGVIGATVFPKCPSAWWSSTLINDHLVNNIQHWTNGVSKQTYHTILSQTETLTTTRDYNNPNSTNVIDAAVVDGLFFVIRKQLFDDAKIKFDTKNFKGFHCYDSDISLQVNLHARVVVVFDVLVEHLQQGTINKDWYDSALILAQKWNKTLPLLKKTVHNETLYNYYETEVLKTFIYWMQGSGYFTNKQIQNVIAYFLPLIPLNKLNRKNKKELYFTQLFGPKLGRIHKLIP